MPDAYRRKTVVPSCGEPVQIVGSELQHGRKTSLGALPEVGRNLTPNGHRFYEATMAKIADELERLNTNIEALV